MEILSIRLPEISDDVNMSKLTSKSVFTFEDLRRLSLSARIASSISLVVCCVIIAVSAWIYFTPSARHHLDRISFRLLLCVMILEIVYDSAWIALFHAWPVYTPGEVACSIGMFSLFGSMAAINYLCACIAINLSLTIVFNVNPKKRHLEQWYVGSSILLGFGVILVPTVLGHFGKNTSRGNSNSFCWFKQVPDQRQKVMRYFVDFYIWQCLSALVATIFVVMLVFKLWRQGRKGSRLALAGLTINIDTKDTSFSRSPLASPSSRMTVLPAVDETEKNAPPQLMDPFASSFSGIPTVAETLEVDKRRPSSPILSAVRRFSTRFGSFAASEAETQCTQVASLNQLHSKLLKVVMRVSAYPVALIIVNILHTAPDIYLTTHGGVKTKTDWRLYCIFTFLYGSRGLVFALLMILVDPCLRKGARAAWNARRNRESKSFHGQESTTTFTNVGQVPHLENHPDPVLALATPNEHAEQGDDLDIFQFFADGAPARHSMSTTIGEETRPKSIVSIVEGSIKASTSPRILRKKLPKVDEEGEQNERWFSKVESML